MSQHRPPMDPNTSEATGPQLERARAQGEAYAQALKYMAEEVAHDGGTQQAGDYLVATPSKTPRACTPSATVR
ncbi:hypothetical protein BJF77_15325 [Kocuria sp. CNJ-770]|uniref:hypothetical protein n=1 Tax=Kocuria sp. CNJ-770 TaxID=1904964 RepID=UPI00096280A8|nr:hypothetical protein [Kocuria sp. CNJ-770]OLT06791.1 hypothetical protein BJF77_15325 [Kocuria sp. CNJ-770]